MTDMEINAFASATALDEAEKAAEQVKVDANKLSNILEELAKNPAVTDIKVTEGTDEVQPA